MRNSLKDMKIGLLFALLTLCFGFLLGGAFGAKEEQFKDKIKADAAAVFESVYHNDQAQVEKMSDKAWTYIKRGHFHGTGIGSAALALIALLAMIQAPVLAKQINAILLGLGGLVYSICWTWAGFLIPALGSAGAAKDKIALLAKPSAGMALLGVLMATVLIAKDAFSPKTE